MPTPHHNFDRDPKNRDQMNYADHIKSGIRRKVVEENWEEKVSLSRDRSIEGKKIHKIMIGKNAK